MGYITTAITIITTNPGAATTTYHRDHRVPPRSHHYATMPLSLLVMHPNLLSRHGTRDPG